MGYLTDDRDEGEIARLRALLKEAGERLDPHGPLRPPEMPGRTICDRIAAEFKVDPAPLPYTARGREILACGAVLATVNPSLSFPVSMAEDEGKATAEFIARACSSFPELVRVAREGLTAEQYRLIASGYNAGQCPIPPPAPYDQARAAAVIEAATRERP